MYKAKPFNEAIIITETPTCMYTVKSYYGNDVAITGDQPNKVFFLINLNI